MRKTSNRGRELVKSSEGCRLKAYRDPVGIWTIGNGHTGTVREGMVITAAQAEVLLKGDLAWAEAAVNKHVTVPLTQSMFDALVSFAYNFGEAKFKRYTLLRTLNQGDYAGTQSLFKNYVYADNKKLTGLITRRQKEAELFGAEGLDPQEELGSQEGRDPQGAINVAPAPPSLFPRLIAWLKRLFGVEPPQGG